MASKLFIIFFCSNIICHTYSQHCATDKCDSDPEESKITILEEWLKTLEETTLNPEFSEPLQSDGKPLIEFIDCQNENAIWSYKYTGTKGKRKIFKGQGTLRFVNNKATSHGYDYGMKSGHCLVKNDDNVKSIEGSFDEKGILNGPTVIEHFDGTRIKGNFINGILHGFTRVYIDEYDEETNLPKSEKHLSMVHFMDSGIPSTKFSKWSFNFNGMKKFHKDSNSGEIILFVPSLNER